jgi:hypothetical protein
MSRNFEKCLEKLFGKTFNDYDEKSYRFIEFLKKQNHQKKGQK